MCVRSRIVNFRRVYVDANARLSTRFRSTPGAARACSSVGRWCAGACVLKKLDLLPFTFGLLIYGSDGVWCEIVRIAHGTTLRTSHRRRPPTTKICARAPRDAAQYAAHVIDHRPHRKRINQKTENMLLPRCACSFRSRIRCASDSHVRVCVFACVLRVRRRHDGEIKTYQ